MLLCQALNYFSNWEKPKDATAIRDSLMEMLGDGQYIAPLLKLTNTHAATPADTYFYR